MKFRRKRKRYVEEDENVFDGLTTTPTQSATQSAVVPTQNQYNQDENEVNDEEMEYILQLVKQHRDNAVKDAQAQDAMRQNQANKIVTDIENFLKQNKQR